MSAELLRRAAALMRERAVRARVQVARELPAETGDSDLDSLATNSLAMAFAGLAAPIGDVAHAQWSPSLTLAVADWLDAAYVAWERSEHSLSAKSVRAMSGATNDPDPHALAVARAYLGESA